MSSEYDRYMKEERNAILFCACKHREGSDIKNLDCCIFLDKVENRNAKTFVQCIGRVLRRDKLNKKKEGVIIDLCASNCLKLCDRMNNYLNCKSNFPWKYTYTQKIINKKLVFINQLKLVKNPIQKIYKEIDYSIQDLKDKFKNIPNVKYKKSIKEAIQSIHLEENDLLIVTGSLYLSGEFLNLN